MDEVFAKLGKYGLVPVAVVARGEDAVPLAAALLQGGLGCVEITYRTAAAEEAIRRIARALPEITLGAGTILTVEQARSAREAGAQFVISPGFNARVADYCLENGIPIIPGVVTPTEIEAAMERGLSLLKFFPAEAMGGVGTLKALSAPYRTVKFFPTGGINMENLADYLRLPSVHCCGGSWLVREKLVSTGRFDRITQHARETVALVGQERGEGAARR